MRTLLLLISLTLGIAPAFGAQLAIIIDDLGYRHTDEQTLSLPSEVTLSILPHTPMGTKLAHLGHANGHEIMLHLPMQSLNGKALGPGGLTNQMDQAETQYQIESALASVPFAQGVNNHMGSLLTQMEQHMNWVMQTLKQHHIFFVDSVTSKYTKAGRQADLLGVPLLKRQMFLDNDFHYPALENQFEKMIIKTHQLGHMIVIAHPHPSTIAFLKKNLSRLSYEGINLVPASYLLPHKLAQENQYIGMSM